MTTKSTFGSYSSRRVSVSGVSPVHNFNLSASMTWTDFITGSDSPNFRQSIRNGNSAVNAMQAVKHSVEAQEGTIVGTYLWSGKTKVDTYSGPPETPAFYIPSEPNFSQSENIAAGNLANAVSQAISGFKGAVAALEAPKTAAMIHGRASSLMRSMWNLNTEYVRLRKLAKKNSSSKNLRRLLAEVRSLYLEYSYGWSPLLSDISSLSDELNRKLNLSQRVSAVGTTTISGPMSTRVYYPGTDNCPTIRSEVNKSELSVRYVGAIDLSAGAGSLPVRFGFNHEEFLPTLWELMPWSFVIDYFSNVNQVINYAAYSKVKFRYLSRNTRAVNTRAVSCVGFVPASSSSWLKSVTGTTGYTTSRATLTRSKVDLALPSVSLAAEIPSPLQLFNTALLVSTLL